MTRSSSEASADSGRARTCDPTTAAALAALRAAIVAADYPTVWRLHAYELLPRGLDEALRRTLERAAPTTRDLYRLLYFFESLPRARVETLLGADTVGALIAAGVLGAGEGVGSLRSGYRLEVAGDTLLLTENLVGRPEAVYFGEDSQFLRAQLQPPPGGRTLDLCTGTGVQGLRCAQVAAHSDLVDLNPRAVYAATLNAALNGVHERVEVFEGDLWNALPPGRRYDYVTCNPPLMPAADAVELPIFSHGGPDGLREVRRILDGLDEWLAPDGRLCLIGASTGVEGRSDIEVAVRERLEGRYRVRLWLLLKTTLRDWATMISNTAAAFDAAPGAQGRWLGRSRAEYGERLADGVVYTYLLEARQQPEDPSFEVTDFSGFGQNNYWFVDLGRMRAP